MRRWAASHATADDVQVGQRAPALVEAEAVAGEELVGHGEADVAEREVVDEAPVRRSSSVTAARLAGLAQRERSAEEVERQPGVDDVLDEQHVAAVERRVEVLEEPHAAVPARRRRRRAR